VLAQARPPAEQARRTGEAGGPTFHRSKNPSGPGPFMNSSEIYPLVKQPCQSQYNPKNLLEENEQIYPKSNPMGHSVFVKEKQHDGETMKKVYNRHDDEAIYGHESYTTYGQK
jgi:hypothetical protein